MNLRDSCVRVDLCLYEKCMAIYMINNRLCMHFNAFHARIDANRRVCAEN